MDFNFDTSTISSLSTLEPNGTGVLANVVVISGVGALAVPVGSTSERPSAIDGGVRLNSDNSFLEYYTGSQWTSLQSSNTALTNLSNLAGAGLVTQTSAGVFATRSVEAVLGQTTVANGNAISGNITVGLATAGTAGTYVSVTTDAYGRVTAGNTTQAWSTITGTPTTANGYGITDIVQSDSVAELEFGLLSGRGSAGTAGNLYIASDTNALYFDNGTSWSLVQPAISGDITIPAGNTVATLATVNANVGTYNTVTVNSKGLVTAASNTPYLLATDNATITGDWTFTGNLFAEYPTTSTMVATKQYVDDAASGLNVHAAVRTATELELIATYDNGTGGVGATLTGTGALPLIGNVTLVSGDRVLVKNQTTNPTENGIYVVTTVSPNWVLTRSDDFNDSPDGEIEAGDAVYVQEGNLEGTQWVQTTPGDIVLGTSNIIFTQFGGPGSYSAGNGIVINGSVISAVGKAGQIVVDFAGIGLANVATPGNYATVTVDGYGRVTAGNAVQEWSTIVNTPTTLSGYGITDAVVANAPITAGTYTKVTVDSKGLVTLGNTLIESDIPILPWSKIDANTTPTTLAGYGITNAVENYGGTPGILSGLESARPGAGIAGRIYVATDTFLLYRDNGTTWDQIGSEDLFLYTENPSSPVTSTVTGANAASIGSGNTASTALALSTGSGAVSRAYGAETRANGFVTAAGDAQTAKYILRGVTTTGASTELFLDGTSAQMVLPDNSNWTYTVQVSGRRTDAVGGRAGFEVKGVVYRDSGAGTVALQGNPSKTVLSRTNGGLDVTVGVNTTTGAFTVSVTGLAAQTFKWVAVVTTAEVTN